MSKVDICVLTAGRFDLLQECLTAIHKEMEFTPCNLYVFDNGSPADELKMFHSLLEQLFITRTRRINANRGYAAGANQAIRMGSESLVMFVSDDVMLEPGSIRSLVNTMNNDPMIGICGMKLLFPQHSTDASRPAGKVQHVGHSVDLQRNIIHPFLGWSRNNPKTCISGERFSVTGAAFMTRRDAFYKAGRFDEVYGKGYFEDVELCINMRNAGYKVWVDTNAEAYHYVGATFAKRNEESTLKANQQLFLQRNSKFIGWTDWQLR
jgi:GT2 family glycosyltransferase